ncbi:MAG: threonine synthase, partial [Nakamurella sp.]
ADGRLPAGSLVVCTVTGNGLKDPDTAMTFMTEPVVLPVAAEAVTEALGLTG